MIYFKHILAKARMGVYGEEAKKTADAVKPTKHEIKSQKKHEERKAQSEK